MPLYEIFDDQLVSSEKNVNDLILYLEGKNNHNINTSFLTMQFEQFANQYNLDLSNLTNKVQEHYRHAQDKSVNKVVPV